MKPVSINSFFNYSFYLITLVIKQITKHLINCSNSYITLKLKVKLKIMDLKKDTKKHPVARNVACYFCNEFFENNYLQNHITQCSAVLEPCPKKCGAYVQRKSKEKHILQCQKKARPKSQLLDPQQINSLPKSRTESIEYLETQLISLKTSISEERKYRLETQIELQRLEKLQQKVENFTLQLANKIDQLKRSSFEELEKRKTSNVESKLELDKVHLQYQVIDGWQKNIDSSIEYIKNRLIENDNKLLDLEYTLKKHEKRLSVVDRLELEINMVHQKVDDDQFNRQEESLSWRGELNDFKDYFTQENAMIAAVWGDHQKELDALRNMIDVQSNSLSDFKTKYQAIIFDTKSVSQIANENSDTLDSQKNQIQILRENYEQLKLDFNVLHERVQQENHSLPKGRLLWKIDHFKSKMDSAKDHNTVLFSPMFLSSSYGFKLRLQVHLNGIKKWKGRHVIISLQVLKGDFDALLTWPCNIEAKVLLRDQDKGKNLTKCITAKRLEGNEENEEPQESSTQHIFITHSSLEKQNFIKNDTLFFDIIITNDNTPSYKKTTDDTDT